MLSIRNRATSASVLRPFNSLRSLHHWKASPMLTRLFAFALLTFSSLAVSRPSLLLHNAIALQRYSLPIYRAMAVYKHSIFVQRAHRKDSQQSMRKSMLDLTKSVMDYNGWPHLQYWYHQRHTLKCMSVSRKSSTFEQE